MPFKEQHISQAQHNESFVNSFQLDSTPYKDWVLTGIFYSSIHYIDALLATKSPPIHPKAHTSRDTYIEVYLSSIYDDYRDIKEYSEDARYYCKTFTKNDIDDSLSKLQNIKSYLRTTSLPIP